MKFVIKNLKIQERLSEETLCFSASIYIDGKFAFEATNHGHGGCNDYHVTQKGDRALLDAAIAWVKEQPPEVCEDLPDHNDKTKPFVYQRNLDHFIDEAIQAAQLEKEVSRQIKGKVVASIDGKIYAFKVAPSNPMARPEILKKYPAAKFLNDMALDLAVSIYAAQA